LLVDNAHFENRFMIARLRTGFTYALKDEKEVHMKKTRIIAIAVLIVGGGLALHVARAQQPGIKRTDRATAPTAGSTHGAPLRETVTVAADEPVPNLLVMGPAARGTFVRFRVLIDGQPPRAAHGIDVDHQGNGTVTEQRMYQLIRQPKPIADRQFEIEFLDAGVEIYAFTFG
jgi:hypothetical protein